MHMLRDIKIKKIQKNLILPQANPVAVNHVNLIEGC